MFILAIIKIETYEVRFWPASGGALRRQIKFKLDSRELRFDNRQARGTTFNLLKIQSIMKRSKSKYRND